MTRRCYARRKPGLNPDNLSFTADLRIHPSGNQSRKAWRTQGIWAILRVPPCLTAHRADPRASSVIGGRTAANSVEVTPTRLGLPAADFAVSRHG